MNYDEYNNAQLYVSNFATNHNFRSFIDNFPQLSMQNEAIEETDVICALDCMLCDDKHTFFSTIPQGTGLYRARKLKKDSNGIIISTGIGGEYFSDGAFKAVGYNEYESKEAPLHRPHAARNNIEGVSYLYVSEDVITACAELSPQKHDIFSVAIFKNQRELNLFDLKTNKRVTGNKAFDEFQKNYGVLPAVLFTRIMQSFSIPDDHGSIYQITQYLSDRIRKTGVDGLKYQSSKTSKPDITIFNSHPSIMQWERSIIVYVADENAYVDIDTGKVIGKEMYWNSSEVDGIRSQLVKLTTN